MYCVIRKKGSTEHTESSSLSFVAMLWVVWCSTASSAQDLGAPPAWGRPESRTGPRSSGVRRKVRPSVAGCADERLDHRSARRRSAAKLRRSQSPKPRRSPRCRAPLRGGRGGWGRGLAGVASRGRASLCGGQGRGLAGATSGLSSPRGGWGGKLASVTS
jgi:hypothetical protein